MTVKKERRIRLDILEGETIGVRIYVKVAGMWMLEYTIQGEPQSNWYWLHRAKQITCEHSWVEKYEYDFGDCAYCWKCNVMRRNV